jgi:hypothetical protein
MFSSKHCSMCPCPGQWPSARAMAKCKHVFFHPACLWSLVLMLALSHVSVVDLSPPPMHSAPHAVRACSPLARDTCKGARWPRHAPCAMTLRGGGKSEGPMRRELNKNRRPGKDPPMFGPTELLDMMTEGQHSRDWVSERGKK